MPSQERTKDQQTKGRQANQAIDQLSPSDASHAVQPSGPKGDNPSTAGPGPTKVQSNTTENRLGHLNPSAPEDANITPGTAGEK
jgi:hypothetical protein